jgi:hypothetical protein
MGRKKQNAAVARLVDLPAGIVSRFDEQIQLTERFPRKNANSFS